MAKACYLKLSNCIILVMCSAYFNLQCYFLCRRVNTKRFILCRQVSIPLIDIDGQEKFIGGTFVLQNTISSLFGFFGNRIVNQSSVEFFLFLLLFITHFICCMMYSLYPYGQSYITPVYAFRVQVHTHHFKCVTKTDTRIQFQTFSKAQTSQKAKGMIFILKQ